PGSRKWRGSRVEESGRVDVGRFRKSMGRLGKQGALGFLRGGGMGRARDGPDPAILRISVGPARDLPIPNAALDPNLLVYGRLWTLVSDRVGFALPIIGGADVS